MITQEFGFVKEIRSQSAKTFHEPKAFTIMTGWRERWPSHGPRGQCR
jgi:hypothetical protein